MLILRKISFEERNQGKGEEIQSEKGSEPQVTVFFSKGTFHVDNHIKCEADSSVLNSHLDEQRQITCYQVVPSDKKLCHGNFQRKNIKLPQICEEKEDENATSQDVSGGNRIIWQVTYKITFRMFS